MVHLINLQNFRILLQEISEEKIVGVLGVRDKVDLWQR